MGRQSRTPGSKASYPWLLGYLAPAGITASGKTAVRGASQGSGLRAQGVRAAAVLSVLDGGSHTGAGGACLRWETWLGMM